MAQKILIVEDEEKIARFVELELLHEGYEAEKAFDGRTGLDKALSGGFDLVVLDVMLPDCNGHELCQHICSVYEYPIIFMSCLGDSGNIVDAFREGGNDYIVKPAKLENLMERINANLENSEKGQEKGKRLWFKQFMIDTRNRSVYRVRDHVSGEKIELSRTEYDILQAMVNRPDEILLYRQIYKMVWGQEDFGDVRTLMVHVSNLRKKIDENHTEMIRAIRGVGYLFQDM